MLNKINYNRSIPFAKNVNKKGSTTQKNFGATIHMKIKATRQIKKYSQYFPVDLVVSISF
jgi:hypothetical protein